MNRNELIARLAETTAEPERFVICATLGRCHLARSPEGRAALLVECSNSSSALARTSGSLLIGARSHVTFSFNEHTWTSPGVVIECLENSLVSTFVALVLDVAEQIGESTPTVETTFRALAGWERLLRTRLTLSEEREVGLWGELSFILQAPSPDAAVRAWSTDSRGVIDFAGAGIGFEIKTSASRLRHSVSHQQARSSDADLLVVFASVWAVPDAAGRSLADLVTAISDTTGEVVAFEEKLLALGFSRRDSDAYTRRFSLGGITYFRGATIPRIRSFDQSITAIRYVIELDEADAVESAIAAELLARFCGATGP